MKSLNGVLTNLRQQLEETYERVVNDAAKRREYLETAFTHVIVDLQSETAEMQGKILLGDTTVQEKIQKNQTRINELIAKEKRVWPNSNG